MARKRIIYQSEALYAGATGTVVPQQLYRVQDVSHNVEVARQDVNEFGKLAALSREIIEPPTVGLDFTYYIVDGFNEASGIGLTVQGVGEVTAQTSAVSGIMAENSTVAEKNYYVLTVPEGTDASDGGGSYSAAQQATHGVIGIGNGFLTSYGVEASVGDIPSASCSVEASNLRFDVSGAGFQNPAINVADGSIMPGTVDVPQSTTGTLSAAALRPGDVTISFGTASLQMGGAILPGMTSDAAGLSGANVQNFSIDLPLGRTPLQRIGNIFPFSRELDFPINATLSVTANLTNIEKGSVRDLLCNPATKRDITMTMKNRCGAGTSVVYTFKNAQLDSQNMSATIGDNKSVDLSFSTQIGGPADTANGLFVSGSAPAAAPGVTTTTAAPTTTTTTSTTTTTP